MIKFESLNQYDNVWITSDSHYSHKNICRGTTAWDISGGDDSVRDFDTLEDMNSAIIEAIQCVGENDVLLHCGDVAFGEKDNVWEYCYECKGDIILAIGNHDHNILKYARLPEYQHHFKSIAHRQFVQFKGQKIVLDHFPSLVWHQHHKGARLAFGHVHGSNPGVGKSQDVGVDVANKLFGKYRPFTFKEFIELTDKKDKHKNSHHSENTN